MKCRDYEHASVNKERNGGEGANFGATIEDQRRISGI